MRQRMLDALAASVTIASKDELSPRRLNTLTDLFLHGVSKSIQFLPKSSENMIRLGLVR